MKLKNNAITYLILLLCVSLQAQMNSFSYKRSLTGINSTWHQIELPDSLYQKTNKNLSDIRIFGITTDKDTIEAPYFVKVKKDVHQSSKINFETLNISNKKNQYYYTFKILSKKSINQIILNFKEQNFDWQLELQASQNQQDWLSIVKDYRILSIKNNNTDYKFTNINFPKSQFNYYRVIIKSDIKPTLTSAQVLKEETISGDFKTYQIKKITTNEDPKFKKTIINIDLPLSVPVSSIKMNISDTYDYYRPITIKYVTDSLETEKGWKFFYNTAQNATLNSLSTNTFAINDKTTSKLKIVIHNNDNPPLTINTIDIKGYKHNLITRFTQPAEYYLTYGNSTGNSPKYDITQFAHTVPDSISSLQVGKELVINKPNEIKENPLFENNNWLWGILTLIIALLAWFSFKMLQK